MHGLPAAERAAVVELFEPWAGVDRSHRKLAARGSRLELLLGELPAAIRIPIAIPISRLDSTARSRWWLRS